MLDANLKTQLQAYLEKAVRPIHITAFLDDSDASAELQSLLRDLKEVSDRISVTEQRGGERTPSFSLTSPGHDIHLTFAGLPMGHEFTSLVLALLQVGGHPSKLAQDVIEQIRSLDGQYRFETYFSLSCQNCPDVVQALNLMAVLNPNIQHVAIDGALFQQEVEQRGVMSVPTIFLNGEVFGAGRMGVEEIVAKLDTNAGKREAEKILAASGLEYVTLRPTGILPRPAGAWKITLAGSPTYKPTREEQTMRQPGSLPPPDAPPPPGTIARADLAEVAVVCAVEPRCRNRAFVVTQSSEPRAGADWRGQLDSLPGD